MSTEDDIRVKINWDKNLFYIGAQKSGEIQKALFVGELQGVSKHKYVVELLDKKNNGFIVCLTYEGIMDMDGVEYPMVLNDGDN